VQDLQADDDTGAGRAIVPQKKNKKNRKLRAASAGYFELERNKGGGFPSRRHAGLLANF